MFLISSRIEAVPASEMAPYNLQYQSEVVIKAKGGYYLKYKMYLDLVNTFSGYYMNPCVLFHSCNVFTIILQCRK